MNNNELKEQINAVVEARANANAYSEEKSRIYEEVEEKHASLFADAFNANEIRKEAETKLRELTLQAYAETSNKAPEVGVGIRVKTILGYLASEAMDWAMEHKLALKLDTSSFEKIAKTNNLPFVTITEEPQATIATELNKVE